MSARQPLLSALILLGVLASPTALAEDQSTTSTTTPSTASTTTPGTTTTTTPAGTTTTTPAGTTTTTPAGTTTTTPAGTTTTTPTGTTTSTPDGTTTATTTPDGTTTPTGAATAATTAANPSAFSAASLIEKVDATHYLVKRDLIDHYVKNPKEAMRLAHTQWAHNKKGETTGVRLRKIPPRSPLLLVGFQQGDLVQSVNGKPVTTFTEALSALNKLRKKDTVEVQAKHKGGASYTLHFEIE